KPNVDLNATAADIAENPKNLQIKELEAAQVPLSLKDVDIAVINTNFAIVAGLVPTKDSLAIEEGNSPYANVIVVQTKDKDNPVYKKFIKAYQSDEVKKFIEEHFKGSTIAAW
ncbi:MAG: metQ 4, partial [Massilibacillus sp.]|nr:metQ 4 [Massilibacillus sp.]